MISSAHFFGITLMLSQFFLYPAHAGHPNIGNIIPIPISQLQSCQLEVDCYGEITPFNSGIAFQSSLPLITFKVPININRPPPSPYSIFQQNLTQLQAMQISCNFMRYNATESGGVYYGNNYFPGYSVNWYTDSANNWVELKLDCVPIAVLRNPAALGPTPAPTIGNGTH